MRRHNYSLLISDRNSLASLGTKSVGKEGRGMCSSAQQDQMSKLSAMISLSSEISPSVVNKSSALGTPRCSSKLSSCGPCSGQF